MNPNDVTQPTQPQSPPVPAPSPDLETPAKPPKKSSGKIAIIALACLSAFLIATVVFLTIRLMDFTTSRQESDGLTSSDDDTSSSDQPRDNEDGDGSVSSAADPGIAHNAANPTSEQLVDIYIAQTGNNDLTTEFVNISVHASPIKPYEYVHATMNIVEYADTGAAYFYRKDSTSDWVYSYSVGGHAAPDCKDIETQYERRAFYGFDCSISDYSSSVPGAVLEKTITDKYPYYE